MRRHMCVLLPWYNLRSQGRPRTWLSGSESVGERLTPPYVALWKYWNTCQALLYVLLELVASELSRRLSTLTFKAMASPGSNPAGDGEPSLVCSLCLAEPE